MRCRTAFLASLAVVGLTFAGCGSTKKSATTTATTSSVAAGTTTTRGFPPVTSVTYNVKLSGAAANGAPAGAPNGSGLAVISVDASRAELCWKFSQLKNVTSPTLAHISLLATQGLSLGGTYKSAGCTPEHSLILGLLGAHPEKFYVTIYNAQFLAGAVRGQV